MRTFILTVKLPRRPDHDPFNKITGPCPISDLPCSDVTGQHHTIIVRGPSLEAVKATYDQAYHVTRIEDGGE